MPEERSNPTSLNKTTSLGGKTLFIEESVLTISDFLSVFRLANCKTRRTVSRNVCKIKLSLILA
jgi:hypothetical protein